MEKIEEVGIECESCHKRPAEANEFNYIICKECLDFYMGTEIEELVYMTESEQEVYWRMYMNEHGRL